MTPSKPIKPVRPKPVLIGAILAWIGALAGALAGGYLLIPSIQVADLGLGQDVINAYATLGVLMLLWSALAGMGATAAFRGYRWGSILLLVLAVTAAFFLMFGAAAAGAFELLVPLVYIAVATLMFFLPVAGFFYRASYRYRTA